MRTFASLLDLFRQRPGLRRALMLLVGLILLTAAVAVGTSWASALLRADLLDRARMASRVIPSDLVRDLKGTAEDLSNPVYQTIKTRLQVMHSAYPKTRSLSILGQDAHGALFFYADSRPSGSQDEKQPGQAYSGATPEALRVFQTGVPSAKGPFRDSEGAWIHVCMPLFSSSSDKPFAVFDGYLDAQDWTASVALRAAVPVLLALSGVLMALLALWLLRMHFKLRKQSDEQQALLEKMTNAFVLFESVFDEGGRFVSGRFLYLNTAYERMTGVARDSVRGRTVHEVWPDTTPDFTEFVSHVVETGKDRDFEMFHSATGRYYKGSIYRPGTARTRFCVVFEDISARKHDEAALQAAHKNLEAVFSAAPVGLLLFDTDERLLSANAAALTLFNQPADPVEQRLRCGDVFRCVHRDELARGGALPSACASCAFVGALRRALSDPSGTATAHQGEAELSIEGEDAPRWIFYHARALDYEGRRCAVLAVDDVSTQKETEAQVRKLLKESDRARKILLSLLEDEKKTQATLMHERNLLSSLMSNLPDRVYFKDTSSRFIRISASHAASLGLAHPDEAIGKTDADVHPPERASIALQEEAELFRTRLPVERVERVECADGNIRWGSIVKTPIVDQDGTLFGLVGITRDITREIQLQQEIQQKVKMEAIGRLAGGIAHDFNNILQAIRGFGEILALSIPETDPRRDDLNEILGASQRAADLTRQLLTFSRSQTIEPRVLDLNTTVRNMEAMLRRTIGEDIELFVHLAPDLQRVQADANQMEQILLNLVVNARDAMPQGGRLTVSTANLSLDKATAQSYPEGRAGEFVCMAVTDTGEGIEASVLQRIFEPFFTTKSSGKGTGLGLAIIYGIVQQNKGWIHVYSQIGRGTTFKVFLPAFTLLDDSVTPSPVRAAPARGRGERILLVEDEKELRLLGQRVLAQDGYVVFSADSVNAAKALYAREGGNFDLLFSDVILPDGDGAQLAEWFCSQRPGAPVLLCSGYTDERIRWENIQTQGYRFLQKPFAAQDLLRTVRDILDARQGRPISPTNPHTNPAGETT